MRHLNVLDQDGLKEYRLKQKMATNVAIFSGNAAENVKGQTEIIGKELIVPMTNSVWEGSEGHAKLWGEIKDLQAQAKKEMATNAAQAPSATTLESLLQKVIIDITRRRQESGDLTNLWLPRSLISISPRLSPCASCTTMLARCKRSAAAMTAFLSSSRHWESPTPCR